MKKRILVVKKENVGMSNKEAEEMVKRLYDKTPYVRSDEEASKPKAKCHMCCVTYEVQFMIDTAGKKYPVVVCPECRGTDYQERLGRW